ncbi:MAG: glycoside hydrolase family 3 N-terminal domain-containing protein [Bacteroidales bacterium]|nr:glycoside hydrolase family 3 N-terminal domain-containing protein [Bacteroidales bacterium]
MHKLLLSIFLALLPFILNLLSFNASAENAGLENLASEEAQSWVDSVMNSLTLRQKIAQLFMVAAYSNGSQEHIDEISELVRDEKIGGLCFFQGGPVRQAQQTNYYQSLAEVPLLISMDAEWGLGMRLDSATSYPRQMMLGAMDDNRLVYHMGTDIGKQLKRLGVHINFAPVVDINNNPKNPVINTRAFGEDKEQVTQKGLAYMLGLQDNGVLACAKHFPGHGDTDTDSHHTLPLLNHSSQRIDSLELYPFRQLIQNGVAGVMVAHMEVPSIESQKNIPSSLSHNTINGLLKSELNFSGLVITDALNMKGVSEGRKPRDVNIMALMAGNDILLFPSEVAESIKKIEHLVKRGKFPIEEIEARCRKIIRTKYRVGLSRNKPIVIDGLIDDLNTPNSEYLVRQIVGQAITVLNNNEDLIPLRGIDKLKIAYVEIGEGQGTHFNNQLKLYSPITSFSIGATPTEQELDDLLHNLGNYNLVLIGYHCLSSSPIKNFNVSPQVLDFLDKVARKKRTILSLFGTPYALGKLNNTFIHDALIVSYDNSPITQSLTAQLIFGGITAFGRLPISIENSFAVGSGFDAGKKIRLSYSIPEQFGIKTTDLQRIDSLAINAIDNLATPGMQILVAKDGAIIYNKNFGNFTYDTDNYKVESNSIYDIASVTKIAGTLPVVMDMYSKGNLQLESNLGSYLQFPDTSEYADIQISDILLHQSGLAAWIPFYQRTMVSLWPNQPIINGKFSDSYPFFISRNEYLGLHTNPSFKYYQTFKSDAFPHEVARGLYSARWIKDSIYTWITATPIKTKGEYRYSDLGFIMLHWALQEVLDEQPSHYLGKNFYAKLGMDHTLYNPLTKFSPEQIVPTENDVYFRKQLIWGHVHDPASAMLGGESGHAGLFSNANDLAKLMQMYLNKGEYGDERFLPANTIEYFTSCVNCVNGVRRGLGFDKPELDLSKISPACRSATSLSYGHSGFTGSLVWVDPAYNLIYIFISNRVFPDSQNTKLTKSNLRTEIQELIYKAIGTEQIYAE